MPAVACSHVTKRFGDVVAVDDISLDIERGELVALLGPSGCGKTTFLRLLAGFERPDGGTITLGTTTVASPATFVPPERRRVGIVVQEYALFPHLCVGDNVGFGLSGPGCDTRVREVLHLVGLTGLSDRHPHELSGGQQQRVALARALAPRPDIVAFDEPFASLDAALRTRMREEVAGILREAHTTAIFVTHDQEEALSLADRVGVMRDGRILQVDTPRVLYTRPADVFVAAFVGGSNLLGGTSDGDRVTSGLGTFPLADGRPDGPVTLVVRPESVRLRHNEAGLAVVKQVTFYGHDQLVAVRLPNGETVNARLPAASPDFASGDRVEVTVEGAEIISFPSVP